MNYISKFEIKKLELAVNYFNKYIEKNFKGKKVKLNWFTVYEDLFISGKYSNIYSIELNALTNSKYKNLDNLEILKVLCYRYFDYIVMCNEPISNFFIFENEADKNMYNKIEADKIKEKKERIFNSRLCYKCKHFSDRVMGCGNDSIEISLDYILKYIESDFDTVQKYYYIVHYYDCQKRKKLIDELNKSDTYPFDVEKRMNKKLDKLNMPSHFKYKIDEKSGRVDTWFLNPRAVKDCSFFESNDITFDEFMDKHYTIE